MAFATQCGVRISAVLLLLAACAPELPLDEGDEPVTDLDTLLEGAPDNGSLPDEAKADAVYPARFALLATQSPVRNQTGRGVCSIFATTALMEHLYLKAGASAPDFSEQYLQWAVKFQLGKFKNTMGSSTEANLAAIREYGIPPETAWPYENAAWNQDDDAACVGGEGLPSRCYTNGAPPAGASERLFMLPKGRYLSTRSIKAQLFEQETAVVVSLDFFYQAWSHGHSTLPYDPANKARGVVLYPNDTDITESHKNKAGHAILIVGWDDDFEAQRLDAEGRPMVDADGRPVMDRGFYIFKNSWGPNWAKQSPIKPGYGLISMRYVNQYGSAYTSTLPTPGADRFEAKPGAPIPDDDATGVSSRVWVQETGDAGPIKIWIDITHPNVRDLRVELTHNGRTAVLFDRSWSWSDDLHTTWSTDAFEGVDRRGNWVLTVSDHAGRDVGKLDAWSLQF